MFARHFGDELGVEDGHEFIVSRRPRRRPGDCRTPDALDRAPPRSCPVGWRHAGQAASGGRGDTCVVSESDESGLAEAVGALLTRYRTSPTLAHLDLLSRVGAKLAVPGPLDLEQCICTVAVTNVLVDAGLVCWVRDAWVLDVQADRKSVV